MTTQKNTDVTQEELDQMKMHHRKTEYVNEEQVQVFNLVKKYLNPHQGTCASCRNNLRDAKNALNSFYLMYGDEIQARLDAEVAAQQVEEYKTEEKIEPAIKKVVAKRKPVKRKK